MREPGCGILTISGILTAFVLLLGSCATVPKEADLKETLRAAAEKYWNLRLELKYEETYRMEDEQGLPPLDRYRPAAVAMKKISIASISVKEVSVNGDKGDVDLEWTYMLPKITKPLKQIIKDEWVYKSGNWRHLSYPVSYPPGAPK